MTPQHADYMAQRVEAVEERVEAIETARQETAVWRAGQEPRMEAVETSVDKLNQEVFGSQEEDGIRDMVRDLKGNIAFIKWIGIIVGGAIVLDYASRVLSLLHGAKA